MQIGSIRPSPLTDNLDGPYMYVIDSELRTELDECEQKKKNY